MPEITDEPWREWIWPSPDAYLADRDGPEPEPDEALDCDCELCRPPAVTLDQQVQTLADEIRVAAENLRNLRDGPITTSGGSGGYTVTYYNDTPAPVRRSRITYLDVDGNPIPPPEQTERGDTLTTIRLNYYTRHGGWPSWEMLRLPDGTVVHHDWLATNESLSYADEACDPDDHDCNYTTSGCVIEAYGDEDEEHEYDCRFSYGWFANPFDDNVAKAAYQMARTIEWGSYRDQGYELQLAQIADSLHLPSGLAAWDSIVLGYFHDIGIPARHSFENCYDRIYDVLSVLGLSSGVCPIMDSPYTNGWRRSEARYQQDYYIHPGDTPTCRCRQPHCDQCYPNGPPANCPCNDCRLPRLDDLMETDDWVGLPELPQPPDQRCRFGIEIEFNRGNRANIMQSMLRAGIAVLDIGYTHEVTRMWKMTTDASVTGGEIVSPVLSGSDEAIDQVREVIRMVKENNGETGTNVGMHVHLDVTPFETRQLQALAKNLQAVEKFLAAFVPEHRYNGSNSCGAWLFREGEWQYIHNWISQVSPAHRQRGRSNRVSSAPIDRYRSCNFNSLLTYGTVEVRLLGHTLNTAKVRTWIRVLQTIMEASRRRAHIAEGTDVLQWLARYGLEQEHIERYRSVVEQRGNTANLVAVAA